MIMEAMGNIKYADKGNMTKEEIDKTSTPIKAKQGAQFAPSGILRRAST